MMRRPRLSEICARLILSGGVLRFLSNSSATLLQYNYKYNKAVVLGTGAQLIGNLILNCPKILHPFKTVFSPYIDVHVFATTSLPIQRSKINKTKICCFRTI